ncbi:unnamed protein product [Diabrotica balteata]|uniref:Uncharacterized protein n=1 Tax=Diabrotica balteata TaxID=107213 RepID=A0A9P0DUN0_DIABA|nr:unnamed protein product [Diabrotica balteata]
MIQCILVSVILALGLTATCATETKCELEDNCEQSNLDRIRRSVEDKKSTTWPESHSTTKGNSSTGSHLKKGLEDSSDDAFSTPVRKRQNLISFNENYECDSCNSIDFNTNMFGGQAGQTNIFGGQVGQTKIFGGQIGQTNIFGGQIGQTNIWGGQIGQIGGPGFVYYPPKVYNYTITQPTIIGRYNFTVPVPDSNIYNSLVNASFWKIFELPYFNSSFLGDLKYTFNNSFPLISWPSFQYPFWNYQENKYYNSSWMQSNFSSYINWIYNNYDNVIQMCEKYPYFAWPKDAYSYFSWINGNYYYYIINGIANRFNVSLDTRFPDITNQPVIKFNFPISIKSNVYLITISITQLIENNRFSINGIPSGQCICLSPILGNVPAGQQSWAYFLLDHSLAQHLNNQQPGFCFCPYYVNKNPNLNLDINQIVVQLETQSGVIGADFIICLYCKEKKGSPPVWYYFLLNRNTGKIPKEAKLGFCLNTRGEIGNIYQDLYPYPGFIIYPPHQINVAGYDIEQTGYCLCPNPNLKFPENTKIFNYFLRPLHGDTICSCPYPNADLFLPPNTRPSHIILCTENVPNININEVWPLLQLIENVKLSQYCLDGQYYPIIPQETDLKPSEDKKDKEEKQLNQIEPGICVCLSPVLSFNTIKWFINLKHVLSPNIENKKGFCFCPPGDASDSTVVPININELIQPGTCLCFKREISLNIWIYVLLNAGANDKGYDFCICPPACNPYIFSEQMIPGLILYEAQIIVTLDQRYIRKPGVCLCPSVNAKNKGIHYSLWPILFDQTFGNNRCFCPDIEFPVAPIKPQFNTYICLCSDNNKKTIFYLIKNDESANCPCSMIPDTSYNITLLPLPEDNGGNIVPDLVPSQEKHLLEPGTCICLFSITDVTNSQIENWFFSKQSKFLIENYNGQEFCFCPSYHISQNIIITTPPEYIKPGFCLLFERNQQNIWNYQILNQDLEISLTTSESTFTLCPYKPTVNVNFNVSISGIIVYPPVVDMNRVFYPGVCLCPSNSLHKTKGLYYILFPIKNTDPNNIYCSCPVQEPPSTEIIDITYEICLCEIVDFYNNYKNKFYIEFKPHKNNGGCTCSVENNGINGYPLPSYPDQYLNITIIVPPPVTRYPTLPTIKWTTFPPIKWSTLKPLNWSTSPMWPIEPPTYPTDTPGDQHTGTIIWPTKPPTWPTKPLTWPTKPPTWPTWPTTRPSPDHISKNPQTKVPHPTAKPKPTKQPPKPWGDIIGPEYCLCLSIKLNKNNEISWLFVISPPTSHTGGNNGESGYCFCPPTAVTPPSEVDNTQKHKPKPIQKNKCVCMAPYFTLMGQIEWYCFLIDIKSKQKYEESGSTFCFCPYVNNNQQPPNEINSGFPIYAPVYYPGVTYLCVCPTKISNSVKSWIYYTFYPITDKYFNFENGCCACPYSKPDTHTNNNIATPGICLCSTAVYPGSQTFILQQVDSSGNCNCNNGPVFVIYPPSSVFPQLDIEMNTITTSNGFQIDIALLLPVGFVGGQYLNFSVNVFSQILANCFQTGSFQSMSATPFVLKASPARLGLNQVNTGACYRQ